MKLDPITEHMLNELFGKPTERERRLKLERQYENRMESIASSYDSQHRQNLSSCKKHPDTKDEYKCYIKEGIRYSKEMSSLITTHKNNCNKLSDNVEKRSCNWAVNRIFNGRKHEINRDLKHWREYLKQL